MPTESWPAMIAAVTDLGGRITGAHRTCGSIVTVSLALGIVLNIIGRLLLLGAAYARDLRAAVLRRHDRWPLRTRRRRWTVWRDRSRPTCGCFHTCHRPDDLLARAHAGPADRGRADVRGAGRACRLLRDLPSLRPNHHVCSLAAGLRRDRRGRDRGNGLGAACSIPARRIGRARKTDNVVSPATPRPDETSSTPSRTPWVLKRSKTEARTLQA